MPSVGNVGRKFLWAAEGGVLELHGEEKKSWTHLADHLPRNGIAADDLVWLQNSRQEHGLKEFWKVTGCSLVSKKNFDKRYFENTL